MILYLYMVLDSSKPNYPYSFQTIKCMFSFIKPQKKGSDNTPLSLDRITKLFGNDKSLANYSVISGDKLCDVHPGTV